VTGSAQGAPSWQQASGFLGAPAQGTAAGSRARWWLTERDRHAANLGSTLVADGNADVGFDLAVELPTGAAACSFGPLGGAAPGDPFQNTTESMVELQNSRFPAASETPWCGAELTARRLTRAIWPLRG
jgi:hypothetical protein